MKRCDFVDFNLIEKNFLKQNDKFPNTQVKSIHFTKTRRRKKKSFIIIHSENIIKKKR